jgi:hypothetical protein
VPRRSTSPGGQAAFIRASTAGLGTPAYVERYAGFAVGTSSSGTDQTGLDRPGAVVTRMGQAYREAR